MKDEKSLRAPLARVRGLGSAHQGVRHWWGQRVTALALIPLSLYIVGAFFNAVVFGNGYQDAVAWLQSPFATTFMLLFIAVGFHHAVSGAQVVIEDYVHCEVAKTLSLLFIKFAAVFLAVLGILAAVKTLFWSLLPHA